MAVLLAQKARRSNIEAGLAEEQLDLFQDGLARLSGLIPKQRHRDGFAFIKTEPWPVNGATFAVLGDFHFSAQ